MTKKQKKLTKIFSYANLSAEAIIGASATILACCRENSNNPVILDAFINNKGNKITIIFKKNKANDFEKKVIIKVNGDELKRDEWIFENNCIILKNQIYKYDNLLIKYNNNIFLNIDTINCQFYTIKNKSKKLDNENNIEHNFLYDEIDYNWSEVLIDSINSVNNGYIEFYRRLCQIMCIPSPLQIFGEKFLFLNFCNKYISLLSFPPLI